MKALWSWLEDFVSIKQTPDELARLLSERSVEVTGIERPGAEIDDRVVVALVKGLGRHPNADRLKLAELEIGKQTVRVVCGAPNIAKGQKIAFAPAGAHVRNRSGEWTELKTATIRGVESPGMVCSEGELGVAERYDGILVLDPHAKVGGSVKELLGHDVVLNLDVLANRPDLMSMRGVAREIAVLTGAPLKSLQLRLPTAQAEGLPLTVNLKAKTVQRYSAVVLSGLKPVESPPLVRRRLRAVGIRPINAIVDATNYAMKHLGQPMHAFDYDHIHGHQMTVRPAKAGESFTTLDAAKRTAPAGALLIDDSERVIDLAGIMGLDNSVVSDKTERVVLEAAVFDPMTIRQAARRLGLRTEAVGIYERGADAESTMETLAFAYHWLKDIFPELKLERIVDVYPGKSKRPVLTLEADYPGRLLGYAIKPSAIEQTLIRLGCSVTKRRSSFTVLPPSFRSDLNLPEDLVEEVGRILGYDRLPETLPTAGAGRPLANRPGPVVDRLSDILVGAGFDEIVCLSLTGPQEFKLLGLADHEHVPLANPLSAEAGYLRASLLPGLVRTAHDNLRYRDDVALFEVGRLFRPGGKVPTEQRHIAGILTSHDQSAKPFDQLKGIVEGLFAAVSIEVASRADERLTYGAPGRRLQFVAGKKSLAGMAELSPAVRSAAKLKPRAFVFDLNLEDLLPMAGTITHYRPLPALPPVRRDIAFWVGSHVQYADLYRTMRQVSPLIASVELFDRFMKDGKTSYAWHLVYQSDKRTLTGDEVDKLHHQVISALEKKHGVTVRK